MSAMPREERLLDELGVVAEARQRAESWRYSRMAVRALAQQAFTEASASAALSPALRAQYEWPETNGRRLVFVNGVYSAAHSDCSELEASHPDLRFAAEVNGRFTLTVPAGRIERLHWIFVNVPGATPTRWQLDGEVRIEGGHVGIIEQHVGEPGADMLGALSTQLVAGPKADVRWTLASALPESTSLYRRLHARIETAAALRFTHAILGGRLQRHELAVDLAGARAGLDSRGVFILRGRQHADVQLDLRHVARDTACDVLWRGVADERARGIFHGGITVAPGADGSDAKLSNKNLLLSAQAEIDTQPVLEIHADDVKAAHGATVGQVDANALFYLRSRGIPLAEARRLMVAAFCQEALSGIVDQGLRDRLAQQVQAVLPAA